MAKDEKSSIPPPSLIERITAWKSGKEREWFTVWLKVQGLSDPTGMLTDEFVETNHKLVTTRLIQIAVVCGLVLAFIGWARKWW